jgi:hypothetical protein
MPSLLFLPLGIVVWMLCYGPGISLRRPDGQADWRRTAQSRPNPEAELATLLAVEEPDRPDREA